MGAAPTLPNNQQLGKAKRSRQRCLTTDGSLNYIQKRVIASQRVMKKSSPAGRGFR